ncbi:MAG: OmpW/AlkL family protein [Alphaproteobacteria bacterium]
MKKIILGLVAAFLLPQAALAGDNNFKAGDILVRARAVDVISQESSSVSIGGTVNIDDSVVPELDFSYFVTPNVALELIAGITPHHVKTNSGINVGKAWLLPPTLTAQYHFSDFEAVKPYIGAGVNYTHFFNADGGALNAVNYDDSFGLALQAGVDVPIKDNWYFNLDVKKIFISTKVKFSPSGVSAKVDIDPLLVGVGVGYRF